MAAPGAHPFAYNLRREPALDPLAPHSPTDPPASAPNLPTAPAAETSHAAAGRIVDWLRIVRKTARSLLIAQRTGWIVAGTLMAVIIGGFADYFLRAPMQLRLLGLLIASGTLAWCILRFLIPAMRFRPSLTEIALRVEQSGAGKQSGVQGLLASGLELGRAVEGQHTQALAAPVVAHAADTLTKVKAREVFSPRPTLRAVGAGLAAFLLLFGMSVTYPAHTRIGLARMLLPWSSAEWPKRTEIADATHLQHHPLGAALELRAALVRSDRATERTNIAAYFRVLTNGSRGQTRKLLLSPQPSSTDAILADGSATEGTLFERLVEPTGLTSAVPAPRTELAAKTELEYWFESDDDATPPRTILLIDPPAVLRATANVSLPAYAAQMLGAPASTGAQRIDLGAGSDERAAPAPILAGSRISVSFEFNKPLALPTSTDPSTPEGSRWLQSTLGPEASALFTKPETGPAPGATLTSENGGRTWTLSWQHWDSLRLILKPTDEYQISAGEDAAFRFDALKDNPPTASVTAPAEDKSVLATAVVAISGEARDDVALEWVALERQLAAKTPGSESNVPEATPDRVEMVRTLAADQPKEPAEPGAPEAPASIKRLVTTHTLDLSTITGLKPGDELWITALATDAYNLEGQRHEPVRSTIRRLKILSREQLVEQIWNELSSIRRTAIKIDQDQQDIAKAAPPAGPAGADLSARQERTQAGLTERLSRQTQTVKRTQDRIKENGLTDQNVQDVLKNAAEALARAGEQSAKASQDLGDAARQQSKPDSADKAGAPELTKAAEDQKQVRDELANLIDMLDQGEDAFASKRSLERLLDQQKALRDKTGDTGRQTAGKPADQLSPQQQEALEQIAQDQKALADQLRDQVRKMQDRQSKVREKDPAAAEAMEQAAAQSNRDQTPERMEQASKQAQQNQTSSAQQQQTEAIQSMEQMLSKMDQAQKNKDETLKRALAKLMDSLKALIQIQTISIAALNEAAPKGTTDVAALERPMMLHHQNTLGVIEQATAEGGREIGPVVDKIALAAGEMAATVPELRDSHAEPALAHERAALDNLNEALELAQKLQEKAEQKANAAKRAELRAKYEAALKVQVELRDAAQGLVGVEDNRRSRAQARLISDDQAALNETVNKIREETKEILTAKVFVYAHDRLNSLMHSAVGVLTNGSADASVIRNQTAAARVLKSLADALDDRKPPDDPFRKQEDAGGGGQGGSKEQPVVPPAAEIVLLRLMQIEALDLARTAAEAKQPDPSATTDAAKLQTDITDQGRDLIKRLTEKNDGPKPNMPGLKTAPKPGADPAKPTPPSPNAPDKPDGEGGPQ